MKLAGFLIVSVMTFCGVIAAPQPAPDVPKICIFGETRSTPIHDLTVHGNGKVIISLSSVPIATGKRGQFDNGYNTSGEGMYRLPHGTLLHHDNVRRFQNPSAHDHDRTRFLPSQPVYMCAALQCLRLVDAYVVNCRITITRKATLILTCQPARPEAQSLTAWPRLGALKESILQVALLADYTRQKGVSCFLRVIRTKQTSICRVPTSYYSVASPTRQPTTWRPLAREPDKLEPATIEDNQKKKKFC